MTLGLSDLVNPQINNKTTKVQEYQPVVHPLRLPPPVAVVNPKLQILNTKQIKNSKF
jgi:hypothetical protein